MSTNDQPEPKLPKDMMSTCLLTFLRGWNAHGYELMQRLSELNLGSFDQTAVYRTLRQLEQQGLVSSFWDTSASGPARRMYTLTTTGDMMLSGWISMIERYQQGLLSLMDFYKTAAAAGRGQDAKEESK
jgi:PadR family transcriptional regulator, regulatory protein PadR